MGVAKARVESLSHRAEGQAEGCCTLGRRGMGYRTRPHEWKTYELEFMKNCPSLSHSPRAYPSFVYVPRPIVADQREAGMLH